MKTSRIKNLKKLRFNSSRRRRRRRLKILKNKLFYLNMLPATRKLSVTRKERTPNTLFQPARRADRKRKRKICDVLDRFGRENIVASLPVFLDFLFLFRLYICIYYVYIRIYVFIDTKLSPLVNKYPWRRRPKDGYFSHI